MKNILFTLILVSSTIGVAQINNNSTRSNSFGDIQLRRYYAGDTTWKRALVVGYNRSNSDTELHLNYGGDFNVGTRVHGNKFIVHGKLRVLKLRSGYCPPWRAFVRHGHKPTLCAVLTFFSWHSTLIAHAVHIEYINGCGTLFFTRRMLLGNNSNQEKRIHQYYAQSNKKHNAICHLSVFV